MTSGLRTDAEMNERTIDNTCGHGMCEDKGTYTLKASCWNCGWEGRAKFTRGHEAQGYRCECPRCGVRGKIRTGNFVEAAYERIGR